MKKKVMGVIPQLEVIRENRALLDGPSNTDNGSLDQFVLVMQKIRDERQKVEPQEGEQQAF